MIRLSAELLAVVKREPRLTCCEFSQSALEEVLYFYDCRASTPGAIMGGAVPERVVHIYRAYMGYFVRRRKSTTFGYHKEKAFLSFVQASEGYFPK